jgi:hypothetical protein
MDISRYKDITTAIPNAVIAVFLNKTQRNIVRKLTDTDTMSGCLQTLMAEVIPNTYRFTRVLSPSLP